MFLLDPCFQPIGITNGLVNKGLQLDRSRLSITCRYVRLVTAEFATSMTIKGIAIRGTNRYNESTTELPMDIDYIETHPWMPVKKSSRNSAYEVKVIMNFIFIYSSISSVTLITLQFDV